MLNLAAPCGRHEHQQLLTTVVARDADKAVMLLRTHITRTEQLVAAMLHGASGEAVQ
jgi:DNA-binding GntR family transcriptional regulator